MSIQITEARLKELELIEKRYEFLRNGNDGELWNDLDLKPAHWEALQDEFGESFDQMVDSLRSFNTSAY